MVKNNNNINCTNELSRRGLVKILGATGIAGSLAGCGGQRAAEKSGGSGGSETTATTMADGPVKQEGKPVDEALTVAQWAVPSDSQYNPWNSKNFAEPRRMLFDRFMRYNISEQKFYPYAISDWSFDNQSVTLTIRDSLTWHDGTKVTAKDVVNQLKLDMYTGGSLGDYVDTIANDVKKKDDKSATISLNQKVNKQIVLSFLQPKRLIAKESVYGKYVKRADNAGSDDEQSKVISELQNKSIAKPIGNGPFKFENADSQRTLLTKYEDHPDAKMINFPKAEYLYMPSNEKRWNALINDRTDGSATLFMPSNKLNQLPEHTRVGLIPRHWGMGLVFNFNNKHLQKQEVRQAIAHVIDRDAVAKNSGAGTDSKIGVEYPSGLTGQFSGTIKKKWLKGITGKFNKYETSTEKATKLLKSAGYSKQGGSWQDSSGNRLQLDISAPSGFTDWVAGAKTITSNLSSFGIKSKLQAKDNSTYWGKVYTNSEFTIGLQGWANYDYSYPFFHYDFLYSSTDAQDYWKVPKTFQVPPLSNPSGKPQEVTPTQLVTDLSSSSRDKALNQIQELAWITNQTLPVLPVMEKLTQTFLTADEWNVPPKSSPKIQQYWPTEWLPRMGNWTAKRKK
ncbi:ABC transporter substrate-binding protein [Haladaptatus caseinilyticus]|uniref:ABC transporter substrate-binding protein n=1 Tax=Haladaptatus caseinilyticus TaxID=2993314 RepID=UPI00224B225B|nr:ABC transporter substrate-binding protein [Haladaptatus caseinilyticus]